MKEKLRRHWKKLTVAGVVLIVLALCVGKYWPSDDGPSYTKASDDFCDILPYNLFAAPFGAVDGEIATGEIRGVNGPACQLNFEHAPSSMTVAVSFLESTGDAENRYYAVRSALSEHDAWDLSISSKKAQWSLGFMQAVGTAWEGNMVVSVSIMLGTEKGSIDVHFGEPMGRFLEAVIAEIRRANQVSV